jgi:hypothetical protein
VSAPVLGHDVAEAEWVPRLLLTQDTRQRRWTVWLRALLAIPAGVLAFLGALVAYPCLPVAWVAGVITGRVPLAGRRQVGGPVVATLSGCCGHLSLPRPVPA